MDHTAADSTRFLHNAKNPLKCDVIVIDEMSMVDVLLFQSLLNALKPSCRIIMVGDEDQLPSVGAGNVLASVIASGLVPVVRLKEIFRQAAQSLIISNAHRIVEGLGAAEGHARQRFLPAGMSHGGGVRGAGVRPCGPPPAAELRLRPL